MMHQGALAPSESATLWTRIQCQASGHGPLTQGPTWTDEMLPGLRRGVVIVQDAFVAQFWPMVQSEARRYGRAGGDTEELVAEGALALWEAAINFRAAVHQTAFTTYVKNHVHRRIRRAYLKAQGYQNPVSIVPLLHDAPDATDPVSLAEWHMDLSQAVKSLSAADRAALEPRSSTARDRKRRERARRRLRNVLKVSS